MDAERRITDLSTRVEEYWSWVAVALFLLTAVDLLTTLVAAAVIGPGGEGNPLVRYALDAGTGALVALNLAAVVLAVVMFYGLLELVRTAEGRPKVVLSLLLESWLGLLVAVGLFVLANNLSAVVLGRSLLSA